MVFSPLNQKKLTNVSVVSYRPRKTTYELAVYPNKLYEYRRDRRVPLDEILHIQSIFNDVGRGALSKREDVERDLSKDNLEAIRLILDRGAEQRGRKTREYEHGNVRKEVWGHLGKRLRLKSGKALAQEEAEALIKRVGYNIKEGREAKVQANDIIKRAMEADLGDYRRATMAVKIRARRAEAGEVEEWLAGVERKKGSFIEVRPFQRQGQGAAEGSAAIASITDDLYGAILRGCEERGWGIEVLDESEGPAEETPL